MIPNLLIQNDGSIDIAIGRSRKETNWKNREMLWSDLVKKLSTTHRTAESYNEYLSSKKLRQDEIKDIGGFVGGYLSSGRRKAGSVLHRQLVTLDIDFAKGNIWEDFTFLYDNAAAIYSTHKHSPESPRLRLIIPLDRPVLTDEYMAISRKIAGVIGIEFFDHTTFEPSRLMYWPSTSKDGEYDFNYQDGPWLKADDILNSYRDWKDTSEWPVSERNNKVMQKAIQKQGDPLEKPGIVGAFCRTYSVTEVLEKFLSDVYDACDVEGRYSYREGSTAGGLVVYEDKYAYSHHGTDPISNKLCNAFDLVRLHKFGLKDEEAREDTPINKLPSYMAMMDFATRDPEVKKMIVAEKLDKAKDDFADLENDEVEDEDDESWREKLDVDRKGNILSTINNVAVILTHDRLLKGRFATDEFKNRKLLLKSPPWRKVTEDNKYLKDQDEQNLVKYLEKRYNITTRSNIKDAFDTHIDENSFHPVRDYLKELHWDGQERVDTLLIDYLGAEDNAYTRAVTRKTLMGAVARVLHPGIQFDTVLTLVGNQGLGKSTLIKLLGRQWYSDSFGNIQTKEAVESIQGVWIMELAELAGLKKVEVESIKHFISKKDDSFRPAYGRNTVTYKRQCIFIGTTNNTDFLRDPTGNRRFWPVPTMDQQPTKNVFTELTEYEVGQVWAEAMELYKIDGKLFLDDELRSYAEKVQEAHSADSGQRGIIEDYLNKLLPENWEKMDIYERRAFLQGDTSGGVGIYPREKVCVAEIWCELYGKQKGDMAQNNTKEIHDVLRKIPGWREAKSHRVFSIYGKQRTYERVRKSVNTKVYQVDIDDLI